MPDRVLLLTTEYSCASYRCTNMQNMYFKHAEGISYVNGFSQNDKTCSDNVIVNKKENVWTQESRTQH